MNVTEIAGWGVYLGGAIVTLANGIHHLKRHFSGRDDCGAEGLAFVLLPCMGFLWWPLYWLIRWLVLAFDRHAEHRP